MVLQNLGLSGDYDPWKQHWRGVAAAFAWESGKEGLIFSDYLVKITELYTEIKFAFSYNEISTESGQFAKNRMEAGINGAAYNFRKSQIFC